MDKSGNTKEKYLHSELTEKIIRCFYNVYDTLGAGFLESVYVKALMWELRKVGLSFEIEKAINVNYKGNVIGIFRADIVVDNKIIVEVKAVKSLVPQHEAQLINYLRATEFKLGLLVNFGNKLEFKRRIY